MVSSRDECLRGGISDHASSPAPRLPNPAARLDEFDDCLHVELRELCEFAPTLADCAGRLRETADRLDALRDGLRAHADEDFEDDR